MANVYDPLRLAAPILLTANVIAFHDICDRKLGWDTELPNDLTNRWERWLKSLPSVLPCQDAFLEKRATTTEIDLRGFSDASILGCCAVIHAVAKQSDQVCLGLLVSKTRLAKRALRIPTLELVSCHMVSNLLHERSPDSCSNHK